MPRLRLDQDILRLYDDAIGLAKHILHLLGARDVALARRVDVVVVLFSVRRLRVELVEPVDLAQVLQLLHALMH